MTKLLLLGIVVGLTSTVEQPGSALRSGTRLVYEANGQRSPPWTIDSVRLDSVSHCGRAWISRGATSEDRRHCVTNGRLFGWAEQARLWTEDRPVTGHATMRQRRGNGGWAEWVTGEERIDTISGRPFPVVETTMTTFDSLGVGRRRLRERYSVGLMTATWGVFEVPDSTASPGWRRQTEFRLVAIE